MDSSKIKLRTSHAALMALLAVGMLAVAGCQKKPDEDDKGTPPATVAPVGFARTQGVAQVTLTLPETIKVYPELHTRLFNEGKTELESFMETARKDLAEASASGIDMFGYTRAISWAVAGESPQLISLYATEDEFTGGAHPNVNFRTILWDKSAKAEISAVRLFAPGADLKTVDTFLCRQVEAARSKRVGEPVTQAGSGLSCPKLAESHFILIPAASGGTIGAVDVLFAPYEVGPYAEGPYEIRIPATLLRGLIAPAYADQFGGEATAPMAIDKIVDE